MMVQFLIDLFGSDQSCKDATRFFYGAMDGEIAPLFRELPISHLRAMYKRYIARFPQKQASTPEAIQVANWPTIQTPVPYGDGALRVPVEAGDIEAALSCLPSHFGPGSYNKWLSVLMAVHSEMGMDGVALCERYIPGSPGEVERKFKSFTAGGVGIGTLYHIAREHGYQSVNA